MSSVTIYSEALIIAYILDLIIGDPRWIYHPVRLVGNLISALEKSARKYARKDAGRLGRAGIVLALLVILCTGGCACLILYVSRLLHPFAGFLAAVILDYFLFAVKSLKDESMKVAAALNKHDLERARYAVSMIVGRDTKSLSEEGVAKAAVETIAENTSDGVIAPLIYMALGGPVLGWCYKAVNTMDSMIGYKDEKYLYIGRFAAKLDDVVNFIPARIAALLMIASCPLVGLNAREAWRIFRRDRYNHASPNSAQTESVAAGALGVQLAGDASYFGKIVHKKTIGDPIRNIETEDIQRTNRLLYAVSFVALILCVACRGIVGYIL